MTEAMNDVILTRQNQGYAYRCNVCGQFKFGDTTALPSGWIRVTVFDEDNDHSSVGMDLFICSSPCLLNSRDLVEQAGAWT